MTEAEYEKLLKEALSEETKEVQKKKPASYVLDDAPTGNDDMIGRRFGRLVATKRATKKYKGGAGTQIIPAYLCVCDCGNKVIVAKNALLRGTSTSCGCFRREKYSKKVDQYTLDGEFVRRFESLTAAGNATFISKNAIRDCCIGKTTRCANYIWKFVNAEDADEVKPS